MLFGRNVACVAKQSIQVQITAITEGYHIISSTRFYAIEAELFVRVVCPETAQGCLSNMRPPNCAHPAESMAVETRVTSCTSAHVHALLKPPVNANMSLRPMHANADAAKPPKPCLVTRTAPSKVSQCKRTITKIQFVMRQPETSL